MTGYLVPPLHPEPFDKLRTGLPISSFTLSHFRHFKLGCGCTALGTISYSLAITPLLISSTISFPTRISTSFMANSMAVPGLLLVIICPSTTTLSSLYDSFCNSFFLVLHHCMCPPF